MADKPAVVHADYTEDTDGPFREVDVTGEETVGAPTIQLTVYTCDTQPVGAEGEIAYFSDGDGGDPCLGVYTDAGIWARVVLGAEIADS